MAFEEQTMHGGDRRTLEVVGAGTIGQAIGAATAIVMAIIGLAQVYLQVTLSIATIAVGIALLFEGAVATAEYRRASPGGARTAAEGRMTAEFFGGAVGIVLGLLGLIGIAPYTLNAVAAIVLGGATLVGAGVPVEMSRFGGYRASELAKVGRAAGRAAGGMQLLVGLGAVALGILAIAGVPNSTVLTLVAILGLGFSLLLSGTAIGARVISMFETREQ